MSQPWLQESAMAGLSSNQRDDQTFDSDLNSNQVGGGGGGGVLVRKAPAKESSS
jgi:hypothetical protein